MSVQEDSRHLVKRAKSGDREAFDTLIRRHRDHLEAVIRSRLGPRLQRELGADDVLQETLLRALQSIQRFEWKRNGSFFRWLSGIAVKVILEAASSRRSRYLSLDFEVPARRSSSTKAIQREERFDRFEKAIQSLSPDHRKVLTMVRIDGLSVTEVARRMNRSPNAVSHLLLRALRKFREAFGETESFHLPRRTLGKREGRDEE